MNQFFAIAKNTYLQAVRQPAYGIIVLVTLGGLALAPFLTGWTLDDDNKMLRDIGLSTLLIQGLFLACFVSSSVLDTEIEEKTALTVTAKPVRRSVFILGKYAGVMGALITAHYLAGIAFFMAMRHGVLQSSAETSDMTVVILGPGMMILVLIAATLLNYIYERRFLPTAIMLSVPLLSLSTAILLVIDRDFALQKYESTQTIDSLPRDVASREDPFRGIITFRPDPGNAMIEGHQGTLVRSNWKGPINDSDREYLLGISESLKWKQYIRHLVDSTRKFDAIEIIKAALLILGAIGLLASIAVASSTRLGLMATMMINILIISIGLAEDQMIRPLVDAGKIWAMALYRLIPHFQCFWMVDALNENRMIPWSYMVSAMGYAVLFIIALLLLAIALFETREVG